MQAHTRLRHNASVALAATLLLGIAWLWQTRADPTPSQPDATGPSHAAAIAPAQRAVRGPAAETALGSEVEPLAALRARWAHSSLRGADIDGQIRIDAAGRLQFDPDLRRRFEHYLTLIGEFSLDELRLLMLEDVRAQHGAAVAANVADAFDRYLGLRQALAGADLSDATAERFAQVQELRRDWFGTDADALFRDETDYDAYTLLRLALSEDPQLEPGQRRQLLAELEATRPASERSARDVSTTAQLAEEHARQLDARQIDAATRHEERSALWGEEAATRLDDLDRQRSAWEQRLQSYVRARQRILADARLGPRARERALAELLSASFAGTERLRIESLQQAGALPGGG